MSTAPITSLLARVDLLAEIVARWLPLWLFPVVLSALVAAAITLYVRDRRLVPRSAGWLLTSLRIAVIALAVATLLDLASVETVTEEERLELLLVTDASESMAIADAMKSAGDDAPPRRLDAARRALDSPSVEALAAQFRTTFWSIARRLESLTEGPSIAATERGTDLAAPIVDEIIRRPRDSVAAVVLVSDGNHNAPSDLREAARTLRGLAVPVFTIGVGAATPPPDFAVDSVDGAHQVFAGDELPLEVSITHRGMGARQLELVVRDGNVVLGTDVLSVPEGDGLTRWPIAVTVEAAGRRRLTVSIPTFAGEASAANNQLEVWLDVVDARAKVLYVDGAPRWEYRYLRDTWDRDPNVELESFLVPPPPQRQLPDAFPREPDALFAFDVIVLGDVEPTLFTAAEHEFLMRFVEARGGTLIVISGPRSMPFAWSRTPLADVLPVELPMPTPARGHGARIARNGPALSLTAVGEDAASCRLTPGRERNVELWGLLPPPRWVLPIREVRDGSEVLAVAVADGRSDASGTPVLVTRTRGAGKVLFSGLDSTWRWRFRFGDLLYRRFWGKTVRWAVSGRLTAVDDVARLGTDRLLYEPGGTIRISALLQSTPRSDAEPVGIGTIDAIVRRDATDAGKRVTLTRTSGSHSVRRGAGRYEGAIDVAALLSWLRTSDPDSASAARSDAAFEVVLDLPDVPGYANRADRATARFAIERHLPNEALDLHCDHAALELLARESGGEYLRLDQIATLPDRLPEGRRTRERTSTHRLLDHPLALALAFAVLLTLEWILRKRWNLV